MSLTVKQLAHAMAEATTGFEFDNLTSTSQVRLMALATKVLQKLEGEPLDPMRGVDFPFADNH